MDFVFRMSGCTPEQQIPYASGLFQDRAWTWWNSQIQTMGRAATNVLTWGELKEMMRKEYCSQMAIQKLGFEFWKVQKW
ncbi:hypothetical protein HanIR_Chr17g0877131 [Helianthus annuus]|nr:hypothetical protein HanIR_Chr17g0877131 [Helianthus annuus]